MTNEKIRKKSVVLRVLAGSFGIILIVGILSVTNAFVGNPISAAFASKEIKKYIDEEYADLDLELEKATYNFKFSEYMAQARSKDNIDVHFYVYYKNGEVIRDDYQAYVVDGMNTLDRFGEEYTSYLSDILKRELPFSFDKVRVDYFKSSYEHAKDVVVPGMPFDKDIPLPADATLYLTMNDRSIENIANILTELHKVMADNDCMVGTYGIFAEDEVSLVMVHEVTSEDVESGRLTELLQEAHGNPETSRIRVFIKE